MTRLGIGFVGAVAVVSLACAGTTRSGKADSGASGGHEIATASETGEARSPAGAASAPGDATSAGGASKVVEGRVELIDRANNVTLSGTESVGHAFDSFKIDEGTKVTVNGEQASAADVNPGDEVRASFSEKGDELHLERIDVVSPSDAASPGEDAGSPHER